MEVQDHNLLANATFVLPGQSAENLIQTCETYISFVESSKMPSPSDFPDETTYGYAVHAAALSIVRSGKTDMGSQKRDRPWASGVGVQPWPVVVSGWWLGAPWWLACQLPASSRPYTECAISLEETTLHRRTSVQRNLTASSSIGTSQVRGPDSQRQGEIQGKKRQGVAQGPRQKRPKGH